MIWTSGGPCRGASERLVVWHVAHCCLKSAAPSGDFVAGKDICAEAASTVDIALQNPSPMTSIARGFLMDITIGAELSSSRTSGGSSRLFYGGTEDRSDARVAARRTGPQSSNPPEPRLALTSLRRFLPSSRRCFDPSVGRVGRRGTGRVIASRRSRRGRGVARARVG